MKYKLKNYQKDTIKDMEKIEMNGTGGMLHLEMGLGKTLISLDYINNKKGLNLILCSKTLLINWKNEIHKFFSEEDYVYNNIILHKDVVGSLANNITEEELVKYSVVLLSYSTLMTLYSYGTGPQVVFDIVWDRVIADESHAFANQKTLYNQVVHLKKKYCWTLSGTPIRNKYEDLINQIYFVRQIYNKETNKIEHFHDLTMKDLIITKTRKGVGIILPEIKHIRSVTRFSARRQFLHNQLCDKLDSTTCHLVKYVVGRQFCACPYIVRNRLNSIEAKNRWYLTQGYNSPRFIEVVKIINKLIKKRQETNKQEKVIIFSMFTTVLKALIIKLKRANPILICGETSKCDREANLNKFKTTKSFILLMTYKVGSEGLNITEANNVILMEAHWTPSVHEQAIARVYRPGQEKKVTVYSFCYANSIESYIVATCRAKKTMIKGIFKDTEFYGY